MSILEQCLEDLANANIHNANAIGTLTHLFETLAKRIETLEARVKELEGDESE